MKTALFERFELRLTRKDAAACSHPGPCDEEVKAVCQKPYVRRQLDAIGADLIAQELKDYGAWDNGELLDHAQNRQRIVWIAAGNISDDTKGAI